VSGPAPTFDNLNEQHMPLIPTTGILKSYYDTDISSTPSQSNRVSFSRRRDGSIRNHITGFDADASPKGSVETKRRLLRDSMNWPPPPPPRPTSSVDKSCRKSQSENGMVSLPLLAASSGLSRPVRRYSVLEIEEPKEDEVKVQEAAAVDMILALAFSGIWSNRSPVYSGARNDYSLGDVAKCTSHMIIRDDPQEAFNQVSRLKQYVFAFVKRTDGLWTYAILAHRFVDDEGEEYMLFVMHQRGSTKTITKKKWASLVRLVADKTVMEEEMLKPLLPRNISVNSLDGDAISRISYFS
jgi:hypothetical protein